MTPDGVSTEDWERVMQLACDIANASEDDDDAAGRRAGEQMLSLLDDLHKKYGPLPSLLATRADYTDAPHEREYWLLAAYEAAERRDDPKNLVWIAHSLAQYYIEDAGDDDVGVRWLARLEQHLRVFAAEHEAGELQKLRAIVAARRKP